MGKHINNLLGEHTDYRHTYIATGTSAIQRTRWVLLRLAPNINSAPKMFWINQDVCIYIVPVVKCTTRCKRAMSVCSRTINHGSTEAPEVSVAVAKTPRVRFTLKGKVPYFETHPNYEQYR